MLRNVRCPGFLGSRWWLGECSPNSGTCNRLQEPFLCFTQSLITHPRWGQGPTVVTAMPNASHNPQPSCEIWPSGCFYLHHLTSAAQTGGPDPIGSWGDPKVILEGSRRCRPSVSPSELGDWRAVVVMWGWGPARRAAPPSSSAEGREAPPRQANLPSALLLAAALPSASSRCFPAAQL